MRQQNQDETPADPSHAEEMDNASFIAPLAPELREEILLTADESFLVVSLPILLPKPEYYAKGLPRRTDASSVKVWRDLRFRTMRKM
jgi:hypothetical protein